MKIILRPITEEDSSLIVKWRNAPQVAKHCFTRKTITEESNKNFFKTYVVTGIYKQFIVERVEELYGVSSYPIATVYFKDIDQTNKRCELCIFTSDDEEWNTESQYIAIRMMLAKAFDDLHMHKVYSYLFTEFTDEKELLIRSGLHVEAIFEKEVVNSDDAYGDVYRMCIFLEEYLREKNV